jgi:hypothetical protein
MKDLEKIRLIINRLTKQFPDDNILKMSIEQLYYMKHKESELQRACLKYFKLKYPNILIFAIPNGGKRHIITASIMKREGVVRGIPDLFIAYPNGKYAGMFIELKVGTNKLTKHQKEIINVLEKAGYYVTVCYTINEFIKEVDNYMIEK